MSTRVSWVILSALLVGGNAWSEQASVDKLLPAFSQNKGMALSQDNPDEYMALYEHYFESHQYRDAWEVLKKAQMDNVEPKYWLLPLAKLYLSQGQHELMIQDIVLDDRDQWDTPWGAGALLAKARAYYELDQSDDAVALLESLIQKMPEFSALWAELAFVLADDQQWDKAHFSLKKSLTLDHHNVFDLMFLDAWLMTQRGEVSEGYEVYTNLLNKKRDILKVTLGLSHLLMMNDAFAEMKLHTESLYQRYSESYEVALLYGIALSKSDEPEQAIEVLSKIVDMPQEFEDLTRYLLFQQYMAVEQYEQAMTILEPMYYFWPDLDKKVIQATILLKSSHYEQAIELAQDIVNSRQHQSLGFFIMGQAYWQMGERDLALRNFDWIAHYQYPVDIWLKFKKSRKIAEMLSLDWQQLLFSAEQKTMHIVEAVNTQKVDASVMQSIQDERLKSPDLMAYYQAKASLSQKDVATFKLVVDANPWLKQSDYVHDALVDFSELSPGIIEDVLWGLSEKVEEPVFSELNARTHQWLYDAIELYPNQVKPVLDLIEYLRDHEQTAELIKVIEQYQGMWQDEANFVTDVANALFDLKQYTLSTAFYIKAIDKTPDNHALYYALIEAYLKRDNIDEAQHYYDVALMITGTDKIRLQPFGLSLAVKQDHYDAFMSIYHQLDGAEQLSVRNQYIHWIGHAYWLDQKYDEALNAYMDSYAETGLKRDLEGAMASQANREAASKRFETFVLDYLRHFPEDRETRHELSAYFVQYNQFTAAISQYERLLIDDPNDLVALKALVRLYLSIDMPRALGFLERVLDVSPNDVELVDDVAWHNFSTGDLYEAKKWLRKAQNIDSTHPEVQYHLGVLKHRLGSYTEAQAHFERALVYTTNPDAKIEIQSWLDNVQLRLNLINR